MPQAENDFVLAEGTDKSDNSFDREEGTVAGRKKKAMGKLMRSLGVGVIDRWILQGREHKRKKKDCFSRTGDTLTEVCWL